MADDLEVQRGARRAVGVAELEEDRLVRGVGDGDHPGNVGEEYFGWTFLDVASWTASAGDQRRDEFTSATNVVAVADPDQDDDGLDIDPDQYDAALVSPTIEPAGTPGEKIRIQFDSSWRP